MADDLLFRVLEAIEAVAPTEDLPSVEGVTDEELLPLMGTLSRRGWITATALQGRKVLRGQVLDLTPSGITALAAARDAQDADVVDESDVPVPEKRQRRALFMKALYKLTSGNTRAVVRSTVVGAELGWEDAKTRPVVAYLHSRGLVAYRTMDGGISITQQGVDETETALDDPASPTENLAPMSVTVGDLGGGTVQVVHGGSATASNAAAAQPENWWRGVSIQAVGAVIGGIVLLLVSGVLTNWFGLAQEDDQTVATSPTTAGSTTTTAVPGSIIACAGGPCVALRVANTMEAGRDIGAYVRSTPYEEARRLTGVFGSTEVFGVCLVNDGFEAVPGEFRWVKVPFEFAEGDVKPDGSFSSPKSRPSQASTDYGWIAATFLAPPEAVSQLPKCPEAG